VNNVEAGGDFTIATSAAGAMFSWGYNGRGQCGDNLMTFPPSTPVNLTPVMAVVQNATLLAAGDQHACAYVASTQVTWCWGDNGSSQLGFDIGNGVTRTAVPDFVRW
jgi:alpha-tubulin suppressor-like RCC1 family protein